MAHHENETTAPEKAHSDAAAADVAAHGDDTLHTEVGHVEAHSESGLPQLDTSTYASQVFWLVITFTALFLILWRISLPRIGQVIEERRDRIARDLDRASELKANSEAAIEAYESSLAEARGRAHTIAQETRDKLTAETDQTKADQEATLAAKLSKAEAQIAATKEKALQSVKEVAGDTAAAIVGQVLGEAADQSAVDSAVDVAMNTRNG